MAAIHGDTLLGSADELLGWVRRADDLSPAAAALRDRLLAWDRHMSAGSTDAGAFAAWRTEVAVLLTAHPALAPLHEPHGRGAARPLAGRRTARGRRAAAAPGRDRARDRRCGRGARGAGAGRRRRRPTRPGATATACSRSRPCSASPARPSMPVPLSGDTDCVRCTASVPGVSDRSWRGSVARWVWDLDDRRRSRWGVPFGASGDPASPHATDQLATWAAAESVEVVTDWDLLEEETP